ncbi:MAG: patatin-like phospholipase family protein [Acidimicrobiales bacterium]
MRVGLVVGAGGTAGGFFIRAAFGALRDEAGWDPATATSIVGTSAGAINAAHLAADATTGAATGLDGLAALAEALIPPGLGSVDRVVSPLRRIGGRLLALVGPTGRHAPGYDVAAGPFHTGLRVVSVAHRAGTRRVALLRAADDPAAEMYASAAVPGYAAPVEIDGRLHIDGAVHSPTNADLISPDDHDALVVIAAMVPLDGGSVVQRSHRSLLAGELGPWARTTKPVVVIAPTAAELAQRDDHDAFGAAARRRITGALS